MQDKIFQLVSKYGNDMKKVLIYDRIAQGIQDYCANNSIDEVYNTKFVELSASVQQSLTISMEKLFPGGLNILNLFIPKPDIVSSLRLLQNLKTGNSFAEKKSIYEYWKNLLANLHLNSHGP